MLGSMQLLTTKHPTAFGYWLCALDFALHDIHEIAIIAETGDERLQPLIDVLWSRYRPDVLAAVAPPALNDTVPALLNQRTLRDNAPTAYVCQGFVCQQPVNEPGAFLQQLDADLPE